MSASSIIHSTLPISLAIQPATPHQHAVSGPHLGRLRDERQPGPASANTITASQPVAQRPTLPLTFSTPAPGTISTVHNVHTNIAVEWCTYTLTRDPSLDCTDGHKHMPAMHTHFTVCRHMHVVFWQQTTHHQQPLDTRQEWLADSVHAFPPGSIPPTRTHARTLNGPPPGPPPLSTPPAQHCTWGRQVAASSLC